MRSVLPAVAWLPALLACASSGRDSPEPAERLVLATVAGTELSFHTFLAEARGRASPGEFPQSGSGFESFRDRLVHDLLIQEVLLHEAARRGIEIGPDDLRAATRELSSDMADEGRLPELLADRFESFDAWEALLARRLLCARVEDVVRTEISAGYDFTPEQVAEAAPRFVDDLRRPARLRVRQVFATDAERIRAAQQELAEGVPMQDLAVRYNGGDGDLGWMSVAEAPLVLVEATEGLEIGGSTEVVRSALGYHIFQVLDREPASDLPEDEVAIEVEGRLRSEATEQAFREWLAARQDAANVVVDEDAIARVQCCRQGLPFEGDPGARE